MNRQPKTKLGKLLQVPVDSVPTAQAPPEQNTQPMQSYKEWCQQQAQIDALIQIKMESGASRDQALDWAIKMFQMA